MYVPVWPLPEPKTDKHQSTLISGFKLLNTFAGGRAREGQVGSEAPTSAELVAH